MRQPLQTDASTHQQFSLRPTSDKVGAVVEENGSSRDESFPQGAAVGGGIGCTEHSAGEGGRATWTIFFKFLENSNCFCGKRSHYGLFRLSSSSGGSGEMIQGSMTFVATILTFISFLRNTNVCIFQFGNMMLIEHC